VIVKIFFHLSSFEAFSKTLFTSSTLVFLFEINVMSAIDPATDGTRIEIPSNLFSRFVMALVTAMAAPVVEGTIFCAPALPSLQSFLFGPSTIDCEAV